MVINRVTTAIGGSPKCDQLAQAGYDVPGTLALLEPVSSLRALNIG